MKKFFIYILLLATVQTSSISQTSSVSLQPEKNVWVVFDANGVLVEVSRSKITDHIGWHNFLLYAAVYFSNPMRIKNDFFNLLDTVPIHTGNYCGMRDTDGVLLPDIFADWQMGNISSKKLHAYVLRLVKKKSKFEQLILSRLSETLFDAQYADQFVEIIPEGVAFLEECKNKGYKIGLISNWGDEAAFRRVMEKFPDLFILFDDVIVSSQVGLIKPDEQIFKLMMDNDPEAEYVFIDDQIENCRAARKSGMYSIHCRNTSSAFGLFRAPDFGYVRKQFAQLEHILTQQDGCSSSIAAA